MLKFFSRQIFEALVVLFGNGLLNDIAEFLNTINTATVNALNTGVISDAIGIFKGLAASPEISLALTEVEESELMEGIEKKRFAMILARESMIDTEHYHFFPIATERICVMLPADHPLATRQKLSVTALTDQSFLLMHPYTSIYQLCMQIFQNAGIHPSILRTARVESLISAVAVGEGISLFAESNFRLFQHEGVISVPLEESPVLRIGFAYKKAGEYTPAMDCFLHFMADSQKY